MGLQKAFPKTPFRQSVLPETRKGNHWGPAIDAGRQIHRSWAIVIPFVTLTNTVGFTKLNKYVDPNTVWEKRTVPFCSAELAEL